MTWDETKQTLNDRPDIDSAEKLTSADWNDMVEDQKGHNARHEDGGVDELNVQGLSGLLADPQTPDTEDVQDIVGAFTEAATGSNILVSYDDANDTLTIDTTALNLEETRDTVNDLLVGGTNTTLTYDDVNDTLTIDVDAPTTAEFNDHSTRHESGGSDELSVTGLSGDLADEQDAKPHDIGGATHNADTLANLNSKVSDATLDDTNDQREPEAHTTTHQSGGTDEIPLNGLDLPAGAQIDEDGGDLVVRDSGGSIVLRRDETAGTWDFVSGDLVNIASLEADHLFLEQRQNDVVVWQDGTTIYADGKDATISSGAQSTETTNVILDAIESVANNNGTLYIAPGTYIAESPIGTPQRSIDGSTGYEVIGAGRESTIIKSESDFGTNSSLFIVGDYPDSPYPEYQNVRISGITFDHTAATSGGCDVLVFNVNVNDSIIENCRFEGGTLYQIDVSDCSNVTVRNNVCENAPDGAAGIYLFHILTDQNWRDTHDVYSNRIEQATQGIVVDGAQDNWIYNNYIEGTQQQAIITTTTSEFNPVGNDVVANVIVNHDGSEAINFQSNKGRLVGNQIRGSTGRGMLVVGDTADKSGVPVVDVTVQGNVIESHKEWAIRMQSAKHCTVTDNKIRSTKTGADGIQLMSFTSITTEDVSTDNNKISVPDLDFDRQDTFNTINGHGAESANAEEPQYDWPTGSVIEFTDSGDGSGDGVYLITPTGPVQL